MTQTKHCEEDRQITRPPRPYYRPQLLVYGALCDLTAGGSEVGPEGIGQGNQNKSRT